MLVDSVKDNRGLAHKHLLPLQYLANEINCIISFRSVDNSATELIESGYPTKGFHIKGKSASWGPQAGFICEEQRFSKLEDASLSNNQKKPPKRLLIFTRITYFCYQCSLIVKS